MQFALHSTPEEQLQSTDAKAARKMMVKFTPAEKSLQTQTEAKTKLADDLRRIR